MFFWAKKKKHATAPFAQREIAIPLLLVGLWGVRAQAIWVFNNCAASQQPISPTPPPSLHFSKKLPSIILQKRPPDRDAISSAQFPTCQLVRKREKSPRNALVSFGSSWATILLVIPSPASLCANKGGAPSGAQLGPRAKAHFQAYLILRRRSRCKSAVRLFPLQQTPCTRT